MVIWYSDVIYYLVRHKIVWNLNICILLKSKILSMTLFKSNETGKLGKQFFLITHYNFG